MKAAFAAGLLVLATALAGCAHEEQTDPCNAMVEHVEQCEKSAPDAGSSSMPQYDCMGSEAASCVADCVTNAPCDQINAPKSAAGKPLVDCLNGCNSQ